ncbi:hypothetical protein FOA52_014820 [Chlamydomonas sp. UWO 241]|nr:hypothetical protein FOA52_014820 [Chlamydomonas sp. UWO 241]
MMASSSLRVVLDTPSTHADTLSAPSSLSRSERLTSSGADSSGSGYKIVPGAQPSLLTRLRMTEALVEAGAVHEQKLCSAIKSLSGRLKEAEAAIARETARADKADAELAELVPAMMRCLDGAEGTVAKQRSQPAAVSSQADACVAAMAKQRASAHSEVASAHAAQLAVMMEQHASARSEVASAHAAQLAAMAEQLASARSDAATSAAHSHKAAAAHEAALAELRVQLSASRSEVASSHEAAAAREATLSSQLAALRSATDAVSAQLAAAQSQASEAAAAHAHMSASSGQLAAVRSYSPTGGSSVSEGSSKRAVERSSALSYFTPALAMSCTDAGMQVIAKPAPLPPVASTKPAPKSLSRRTACKLTQGCFQYPYAILRAVFDTALTTPHHNDANSDRSSPRSSERLSISSSDGSSTSRMSLSIASHVARMAPGRNQGDIASKPGAPTRAPAPQVPVSEHAPEHAAAPQAANNAPSSRPGSAASYLYSDSSASSPASSASSASSFPSSVAMLTPAAGKSCYLYSEVDAEVERDNLRMIDGLPVTDAIKDRLRRDYHMKVEARRNYEILNSRAVQALDEVSSHGQQQLWNAREEIAVLTAELNYRRWQVAQHTDAEAMVRWLQERVTAVVHEAAASKAGVISEANAVVSKLAEQYAELVRQLEGSRSEADALRSQLWVAHSGAAMRPAEQSQELAQARSEVDALRSQLAGSRPAAAVKAERSLAAGVISQLRSKLDAAEVEALELDAQTRWRTIQLAAANVERLDAMSEQVASTRSDAAVHAHQLAAELRELQAQLSASLSEAASSHEVAAAREAALAELQAQLSASRSEAAASHEAVAASREVAAASDKALAEMWAQLSASRSEAASSHKVATASEETLAELQAQLSASRSEVASSQEAAAASSEVVAASEEPLAEVWEQLSASHSEAAASREASAARESALASQLSASRAEVASSHEAAAAREATLASLLAASRSAMDAVCAQLAIVQTQASEAAAAHAAQMSVLSGQLAAARSCSTSGSSFLSEGLPTLGYERSSARSYFAPPLSKSCTNGGVDVIAKPLSKSCTNGGVDVIAKPLSPPAATKPAAKSLWRRTVHKLTPGCFQHPTVL